MKLKKKLFLFFDFQRLLLKKIKNFSARLNTPRRKIVFAFSLGLVFALIYLSVSLLSISRAEIAAAELEKSFREESICHEKCYFWRKNQEDVIVFYLKKGSPKLDKRILDYWRDPEENFDFKKELVRILFLAYGRNNPPSYIGDYLFDSSADQKLAREILINFEFDSSDSRNILDNLYEKIGKTASSAEKIEAIKTLSRVALDSEINNYFLLLNSGEDAAVKRQVIKNISNILEKSKYFTLDQLAIIKNLILNSETDISLRQELTLLIGDYYLIYPDESAAIWKDIYENKNLDSISRLFSADSLNHLAGAGLELPAVSSEEWSVYYNK